MLIPSLTPNVLMRVCYLQALILLYQQFVFIFSNYVKLGLCLRVMGWYQSVLWLLCIIYVLDDLLCGVVVEFLATDRKLLIRFLELPDFLRSSGSGMGSTQPREYN
jgi:hypothetical protein